jgi:hypothetical protein
MERRGITRRDFLHAAAASLGTLALGCNSIENDSARISKPRPFPAVTASPIVLSAQQLRQSRFAEAHLHSRASLGFKGYSPEAVLATELQNDSWTVEPRPFDIDVPVELTSYGQMFEFFMDQHLTPTVARRLARGIRVDPRSPHANWVDINSRMLNISKSITQHWTQVNTLGWSIYGYNYHELLGHFPDTIYSASLYPLDVFWPIEAGKWQMLGEVNNISGPLVEGNFNWKINASLPTDVGESIAKDYIEGKDMQQRFVHGSEQIPAVVQEVAGEVGKKEENLRFNKYASFLLGKKILERVRAGTFAFSDSMQESYHDFLRNAFIEIFPEMMRGVFINPNLVNNNLNVLSGAQQLISALRQDFVPIDKLRQIAKNTPPEIDQLWKEERKQFTKPAEYSYAQPDPLQKRVEDVYREVVHKGARGLPYDFTLQKADLELWNEHLEVVHAVCRVYYRLSNLDPNNHRDRFDPNLHIWQIREIEKSLDPAFIQTFLADHFRFNGEPISKEKREQLIRNTVILKGFHDSDAFGT